MGIADIYNAGVISNDVVAPASFDHCKRLLHAEIHRKARAVVSTIAALADPPAIAAIDTGGVRMFDWSHGMSAIPALSAKPADAIAMRRPGARRPKCQPPP